MLRCIEIAQNGLGITAPNPMVGAVLVHDSKIIGEGFTSAYGKSHAEVNAIQSVSDKSLLSEATLYVTLEPCCHFGKTPPCVDLIIQHKIPNVYVGILDPHDKVAGKGIEKLKEAGCQVSFGILEQECLEHHKRFIRFHTAKRPFIILKWAETLDGFIAPEKKLRNTKPEPFWISNSYSKQLVHKWRAEEHSILVGTNTVIEDNPILDVRHWVGENPTRIILDPSLKITKKSNVLDGRIKTIVLTEMEDKSKYFDGIDYLVMNFSKDVAKQICSIIHSLHITSVIIEGGSKTLQTFIDENLWDEARVITGNSTFKKGIKAPVFTGNPMSSNKIGTDTLKIYRND